LYIACVGAQFAEKGWGLSTGNALGADQAFAAGFNRVAPERVELWLPWSRYERDTVLLYNKVALASESRPKHVTAASQAVGDSWSYLKQSVQKLLVRNAMIILRQEQGPVDLVVAWPMQTAEGWSGTGHAMRIAAANNIPVFLLPEHRRWLPYEGQPQARQQPPLNLSLPGITLPIGA